MLPHLAHRAGHDGEVVGADRDRPAVDLTHAGDHSVGGEVAVAEPGVHVVGEQRVLDPRARVEQEVESLAHGELAQRMLALDPLRPAHLEGAVAARFEVADQRPPVVNVATPRRGHGVILARRAPATHRARL